MTSVFSLAGVPASGSCWMKPSEASALDHAGSSRRPLIVIRSDMRKARSRFFRGAISPGEPKVPAGSGTAGLAEAYEETRRSSTMLQLMAISGSFRRLEREIVKIDHAVGLRPRSHATRDRLGPVVLKKELAV